MSWVLKEILFVKPLMPCITSFWCFSWNLWMESQAWHSVWVIIPFSQVPLIEVSLELKWIQLRTWGKAVQRLKLFIWAGSATKDSLFKNVTDNSWELGNVLSKFNEFYLPINCFLNEETDPAIEVKASLASRSFAVTSHIQRNVLDKKWPSIMKRVWLILRKWIFLYWLRAVWIMFV